MKQSRTSQREKIMLLIVRGKRAKSNLGLEQWLHNLPADEQVGQESKAGKDTSEFFSLQQTISPFSLLILPFFLNFDGKLMRTSCCVPCVCLSN